MKSHIIPISTFLALFANAVCAEDPYGINYPSVDAALADLKKNPDAQVTLQQGWTVVMLQEPNKITYGHLLQNHMLLTRRL